MEASSGVTTATGKAASGGVTRDPAVPDESDAAELAELGAELDFVAVGDRLSISGQGHLPLAGVDEPGNPAGLGAESEKGGSIAPETALGGPNAPQLDTEAGVATQAATGGQDAPPPPAAGRTVEWVQIGWSDGTVGTFLEVNQ